MSFILLGILNSQAAGAAATYYASLLTLQGVDQFRGVVHDSSDNAYVVGETEFGGGARSIWLMKFNIEGVIQWSRILSGNGGDYGYGLGIDSSDNVYVIGEVASAGLGGTEFLIAKYNSSGTIQFQRTLGTSANNWGYGIAVDSSGNSYLVGRTATGTGTDSGLIAKYDSSGTIQWQRTLGSNWLDQFTGAVVDSSGNVYASGTYRFDNSGSATDGMVAKYNSSGVLQWQRKWGTTSFGDPNFANKISVDSNDNVIFTSQGWNGSTYGYVANVAKINSSGTVQWQRSLRGTVTDAFQFPAVDADDNIYLVGNTNSSQAGGSGNNDVLMAKYNSSGVIQWQRVYGGTSSDIGYGVGLDSVGSLYVVGSTGGAANAMINKFPNDGSGTGSYVLDGVTYTYQASGLNEAALGYTVAAISLTDAAATHTDQSSSLTDSAASTTQYIETF